MLPVVVRPSAPRLVAHAASRTTTLGAVACVITLAVVTTSSWLFAAACALYLALVARDVADPRFWRRTLAAEAAAQRQLPQTSELSVDALRELVTALRDGFDEIERAWRQAPERVKAQLAGTRVAVGELEAHAAAEVRQANRLCMYLRAVQRERVEMELGRLEAMRDRSDGAAREEYERAIAIRRGQLATIDEIRGAHDRTFATLHVVVAAIEALPARIYRLRLAEGAPAGEHEIAEQLGRIDGDVLASQQLLDAALAAPDDAA